jgi:flavin-dependent dehydrogenase
LETRELLPEVPSELRDVVVVGAGISGLKSAELLASAGLDVVVLEKNGTVGGSFGENLEAFPEYHYAKLNFEIPSTGVREVTLYCGEGQSKRKLSLKFRAPVFRVVKRGPAPDSIDSYLYHRARKTSAEIRFNEKFESAKPDNSKIVVRTSADEYRCRVVIGADGVFSSVRKSLHLSGNQKTEGVGYIAKVEGAQLGQSEILGIFNYKRWPGSYCYIMGYPKEDYATVGMTLRPPYADTLVHRYYDSLIEYLPEILGGARMVDLTRGFVTLGSRDRVLSASLGSSGINNFLFVGEAGGFQDPTLAFGLAPALQSAGIASFCIIRAMKNNDFRSLNEYPILARQELVRVETKRLSFRYMLESMTEDELSSFLVTIARNPETVERVMRTGEYVRYFLPLVVRTASRNPRMLGFPFRFVRTSRALKSRQVISRKV